MSAPFDDGARYDRTRFETRAARARFRAMERHVLAALEGRRAVLDLGCGTGRLTERVAAPCVVGLDRSGAMLAQATRRGLAVAHGDAHALPFSTRCFDAIVSTDSVFTLLDWPRAWAECARVSCRGARVVVHHPAHTIWSPRRPWRLTPGWGARSAEAFVAAAVDAGFALESARLWRWLRAAPYLVRVPARPGWPVWNHGVFVFRRG